MTKHLSTLSSTFMLTALALTLAFFANEQHQLNQAREPIRFECKTMPTARNNIIVDSTVCRQTFN